jgi:hypothetical protein
MTYVKHVTEFQWKPLVKLKRATRNSRNSRTEKTESTAHPERCSNPKFWFLSEKVVLSNPGVSISVVFVVLILGVVTRENVQFQSTKSFLGA